LEETEEAKESEETDDPFDELLGFLGFFGCVGILSSVTNLLFIRTYSYISPRSPMSPRIPLYATLTLLTLALLTACEIATDRLQDRTAAEEYIRANITQLSTQPAVLGGTFYVTDIQWADDGTATVKYEDNHIALVGETKIDSSVPVTVAILTNVREDVPPPSSQPGRAPAKEGEFCGGIAAFQCEEGLTCKLDGTYPDAGGVCVKK
jgi:hypothetical protein